jgi:hypothetical protein
MNKRGMNQRVKKSEWEGAKDKVSKVLGPALLTFFTGPFSTASMLLQVADNNPNESLVRKIKTAGPQDKFVRLGVMGDNTIYKAFQFKGYQDCLAQMGKEGIRGLYKGNLLGILLGMANAMIRTSLYEGLNRIANFSSEWKSNLLSRDCIT